MKVAINRCFGGFGISNEAFEKLLTLKGIEFEKVASKYGDYDYYKAGCNRQDEAYLSPYEYTNDRSDLHLISILEEMGRDAWGFAAEIVIVDVPDDIEWHISEYDGLEHVAENHRTWSH